MTMKSRRLVLLGAAIGGAVVVAVVLIVVAAGGSSKKATTTAGGTGTSVADPVSLFAGVPQRGDTLGKTGAPASILVFEDPQCPYCAEWTLNALPTVVDQFVRPGKVKLVYRGIAILGPNSVKGLRAVFAAGKQNKLWNVSEALYQMQGAENSGWITDTAISSAARKAGANGAQIVADSPSKSVSAQLVVADRAATMYQVRGVPTFLIVQPPALPRQLNVTSLDPGAFSADLQQALAQ